MSLEIEMRGFLYRIVVSSLPKAFMSKVFRHCRGKSNTPYFTNNCFKGILYFDNELAVKYAKDVGYDWTFWYEQDKFHKRDGLSFEYNLELSVSAGGKTSPMEAADVQQTQSGLGLAEFTKQIGEDEVVILLGSVDKATETFVLEDFNGAFKKDKLNVSLISYEEFFLSSLLVDGVTYDGMEMTRKKGPSTGKSMVTPVMFGSDGNELDQDDFPGEKEFIPGQF